MAIFILNHRRSWVTLRTSDYPLPQFVEIRRSHRLRKGKFPRKDGRNANFIWLDIYIWRDDGPRCIVDTFTLPKKNSI
jgi:hypothetical protein